MFAALFKKKDSLEITLKRQADGYYACALSQTRLPAFYESYGVPDTFDGRYDLLLLHIYLVLNKVMKTADHEPLAQAIFDVTFKDMDQTLREIGIGDMGVPKHMRRMMMAFNGRMHAYQYALEPQSLKDVKIEGLKPASLAEALRRNLYATNDSVTEEQVTKMEAYVRGNIQSMTLSDNGQAEFVSP